MSVRPLAPPYLRRVEEGEAADWRPSGARVVLDPEALSLPEWVRSGSFALLCDPGQRHQVLRSLAAQLTEDPALANHGFALATLGQTGELLRLDVIELQRYGTVLNRLPEPPYGEPLGELMWGARLDGLLNDQHADRSRAERGRKRLETAEARRAGSDSGREAQS